MNAARAVAGSAAQILAGPVHEGLRVAELPAVHRWLVEAHQSHPHLFALACVALLLALGTLVGLASEALLGRLGRANGAMPKTP